VNNLAGDIDLHLHMTLSIIRLHRDPARRPLSTAMNFHGASSVAHRSRSDLAERCSAEGSQCRKPYAFAREPHLQRRHQHFKIRTARCPKTLAWSGRVLLTCPGTYPMESVRSVDIEGQGSVPSPCFHCITYADIEQTSPLPEYTPCLSVGSRTPRTTPSSMPTHKAPNCSMRYILQMEVLKKLVQLILMGKVHSHPPCFHRITYTDIKQISPLPKFTHPLLIRLFKNTSHHVFINAYPQSTELLLWRVLWCCSARNHFKWR